jgi:uncharacterized protein
MLAAMADSSVIQIERVVQTHASIVLLDADHAYKLKKPVKFPFLDYSSPQARKHFCFEELRLNRRFSPGWYLGVAAVFKDGDNWRLGPVYDAPPPDDPPGAEYAVMMRRVPDSAWLPRHVHDGRLDPGVLGALMSLLVDAWGDAPPDAEVQAAGMPENLRRNTVANIAECREFVPECLSEESWARLDLLLRGWFEANPEVFEQRARAGRVRDGHGDLKPTNIAIADGKPVVTDCIEFNPLFRRLDTLCEAAFLATGLESLGAFEAGRQVLRAYARAARDDYPDALRRYYQAHLACVMGKVTALQLRDAGVVGAARDAARRLARHCFALADFHAREPHVIVVSGIMGCGKSTVAEALSRATGLPVVSSDVERKRMFGVKPTERLPAGAYTDATGRKVYERLYAATEVAGAGVILDGMFPTREMRARVTAIAPDALFVHCDAPDDVVRARMKERLDDPSRVSDATPELLERARQRYEPPAPEEGLRLLHHDAAGPPQHATAAVLHELLGPDYNPEEAAP